MHRRKLAACTASLLAAVALAACGDDDNGGEDGGSEQALNRSALAAQAVSICKRYEGQLQQLDRPTTQDVKALAPFLKQLADLGGKVEADHKALKADDDVKADWDSYLAEQAKLLAAASSAADAAAKGDEAGVQKFGTEASKTEAAEAAAKKVGVSECI